jgi:aspartyl-tRNA(Asn)/glutamyl-tRNA(Gln) amidotransferase subunit A
MSDGFAGWTIPQFARAFRSRSISPVDVAQWAIAEAASLNSLLGTVLTHIANDDALAMAQASERRWLQGTPLGLLDGSPVTIKNLLAVKDWPLDFCSLTVVPASRAGFDAPAVARLREAGMVFVGYTSTPEFSWKLVTDSPKYGVLANPHDTSRTAGGSSGGAAVCAAMGLAPVNLGSDAAGSIRVPASFCGVFGMKPTFGAVAAYPAGLLTHIGPLARDVGDAALVLDAIGRPDRRDWYNTPFERPDAFSHRLGNSPAGLRVAYVPRLAGLTPTADVETAVAATVSRLAALGANVELMDLSMADPGDIGRILFSGGYVSRFRSMDADARSKCDPALAAMAEQAESYSADDIRRAHDLRYQLGCQLSVLFEDFDLLVTPTTICPAFHLGRNSPNGYSDEIASWSAYTYLFNLTHNPAASVPCRTSSEELPIGMQIVGPKFGDAMVLMASRALSGEDSARPVS